MIGQLPHQQESYVKCNIASAKFGFPTNKLEVDLGLCSRSGNNTHHILMDTKRYTQTQYSYPKIYID